jgi:hypothetical protein
MPQYKVTHIGYVTADDITKVHQKMEDCLVLFSEMHIEEIT